MIPKPVSTLKASDSLINDFNSEAGLPQKVGTVEHDLGVSKSEGTPIAGWFSSWKIP